MAQASLPIAPPIDVDDVLGLEQKCMELARRCETIRGEIKLLGAHDAIGSASERKLKGDSLTAARGALLEVSVALSMNLIAAGSFKLAVSSSQDALASAQSIFGEGTIDTLVPSLLLAESSLGIGKLAEVEELLSAASWVLVQQGGPDDHMLRARLLCVRGRLQASQFQSGMLEGKESESDPRDKLLAAQKSFAEEAFEASMSAGPGSIETAAAFFRLGKVALDLEETGDSEATSAPSSTAMAFFDKVVEIWYQQVSPVPGSGSGSGPQAGPDAGADMEGGHEMGLSGAGGAADEHAAGALPRPVEHVSLAAVAEAIGMLRFIRDYRLAALGEDHVAYHECRLALGMCLWAAGAHRAGLEECRSVPGAMRKSMEDDHPAVESASSAVGAMEAELEAAAASGDDDLGGGGVSAPASGHEG